VIGGVGGNLRMLFSKSCIVAFAALFGITGTSDMGEHCHSLVPQSWEVGSDTDCGFKVTVTRSSTKAGSEKG
jgi:hypothetical protein